MIARVADALIGARRTPLALAWLALCALAASTVVLAQIFDRYQPITDWLFFRYAVVLACTGLFCAAALASDT